MYQAYTVPLTDAHPAPTSFKALVHFLSAAERKENQAETNNPNLVGGGMFAHVELLIFLEMTVVLSTTETKLNQRIAEHGQEVHYL